MTQHIDIIRHLADGTAPVSILRLAAQAVLANINTARPFTPTPAAPVTVAPLKGEPGSAAPKRRGRPTGTTNAKSEASWKYCGGNPYRGTGRELTDMFDISREVVQEQRRVMHFLNDHGIEAGTLTWAMARHTAKEMGFHVK